MERNPEIKKSVFDCSSDDEDELIIITMSAGDHRVFAGSWDIYVKGDFQIKPALREGELLPRDGICEEAIRIVAGNSGCILRVRQILPKRVF